MLKDLSKIPLFASMPADELSQLAEIIEVKALAKGDVLFWEGEPAQGLFFIKQGTVQMSKTSAEGKQAILQIYSAGEVLAEAVLFADAPYPATAEAVEPCTVYFLSRPAMHDLMLRHPRIALYIIGVLSARLREAQDKLKLWAYANAESRVSRLLLNLARHHGTKGRNGVLVGIELPHSRLAALTGLTRETVSRVLSAFRTEGIIHTQQRKLVITDLDKLRNYCKE